MIAGDKRERGGDGGGGGGGEGSCGCSKPINAYFKVGEGNRSQFCKMIMV